jgi:acyl transferase domain-containing protein
LSVRLSKKPTRRFIEWANYSQGGIVSAEGKCKPFDVDADGCVTLGFSWDTDLTGVPPSFARGEGVVTIVLKPLEAALRDGDRIYGSILGSAINSTGSVAPVSAPVAAAQQAAMEAALEQTGRSPQDVDFLELHATGTSRGDPTEANWVGHWFKRSGEILVGSVKGNIGYATPCGDDFL